MAIKAVSRLITGAADYEAGLWTPRLEGQAVAGVQVYNGADGFYRKIDDMVFAFFQINLSTLGSAGDAPSGNALVAGLPFAARENSPDDYMTFPAVIADLSFVDIDAAVHSVYGRVFNGTSAIRLRTASDAAGAGNLDISAFSTGTALVIGSAIYLTD